MYEDKIASWQTEYNRAKARADLPSDSTGGKKRPPVPFGWGADQCVFAFMRHAGYFARTLVHEFSSKNMIEVVLQARPSDRKIKFIATGFHCRLFDAE